MDMYAELLTGSLVDRYSPVFNVAVANVLSTKRRLLNTNISNSQSLTIFPVFPCCQQDI